MTGFKGHKPEAAGFPIQAFGNDGDFESPPDGVRQILRDAKQANSPAMDVANSPQP